jgi:hypothetical protein
MIINDVPTHFTNNHAVSMTMRDYFAAEAMKPLTQSFLNEHLDMLDPNGWMDGLAMDAYSMADAMMKARTE